MSIGHLSSLILLLAACCSLAHFPVGRASVATDDTDYKYRYGVDISFPMHHERVSINYPWLEHNVNSDIPTPPEYTDMPIQPLGNVQERYDDYMQGCVDYYNQYENPRGDRCWDNEIERIHMTSRQPQSVYNYTQLGYKKMRAPDHVFQLLKDFWDKNKGMEAKEKWPIANIYTNHWKNATKLLSVEDPSLNGGGFVLKQHIWNAARDTIEEWTGYRQAESSLYGIRVYQKGAMLAPHVDRLPLVSSAIINVAQDVDEPWPLAVIGHDGIERNITMEPGDMVLYESHSVIHGRQFPLQGRFMANCFVHFEPVGEIGGQYITKGDLPPYVIPDTKLAVQWKRENPRGHKIKGRRAEFATGSTELHHSAMSGDLEGVTATLDKHAHLVNVRDVNGWSPLHEAIRNGNVEIVQLLLDRGAEMNARTGKHENGQTPLALARATHGKRSHITKLLESRGARSIQFGEEL